MWHENIAFSLIDALKATCSLKALQIPASEATAGHPESWQALFYTQTADIKSSFSVPYSPSQNPPAFSDHSNQ